MYIRATSLPKLYIRNIIPDDMGIPLLGYRALSGWGYAELRRDGVLRSSPCKHSHRYISSATLLEKNGLVADGKILNKW